MLQQIYKKDKIIYPFYIKYTNNLIIPTPIILKINVAINETVNILLFNFFIFFINQFSPLNKLYVLKRRINLLF